MTTGASAGAGPFRAAYAAALGDHLRAPTEATLRAAYELAREAVGRRLSVLDLAVAHQEALLAALAGASSAGEVQHVTRAAGDFFLEGLSTFEMVQRGFSEARQAALLERRHIELSRRLSTFLADASLALDAHDSLQEMLRLVAEQARELVGPTAAWPPWRWRVSPGSPKRRRTRRPTCPGRRSSGGSIAWRSTASCAWAAAR